MHTLKSGDYYRVDHPFVGPDDETHMEIHVSYSLGGPNYYNGTINKRGVYAHFTPVKIENRETGFSSRVMKLGGAGAGRKLLMKELKRKSDKAGEECAAKLEAVEVQVVEAATNFDWPRIHALLR